MSKHEITIRADYNPETGWLTVRKSLPDSDYLHICYESNHKTIEEAMLKAKKYIKSLEKIHELIAK